MLPSTAITRLELSSTFSEFDLAMSRRGFIGPRVLRPRLVSVQAADVGKIPIEALLRTKPDDRAPGGGYGRDDAEFTKFSYATDEHGREVPLDDRTVKVYRDILDAEAIHAQRAQDMVLRNFEIAVAAAIYNTTTWTGSTLTTAIEHEMDDHTNAIPMAVIEAAKQKVRDLSGLEPNALICNSKQFWNICHCDDITGLLKYSGYDSPRELVAAGPAAAAVLAQIFQLDQVLVAGGIKNTAKEGQSASMSSVWSDEYMMVARVATTDDPQEPCVGRTFLWAEENAGVGSSEELALIVEEYREEGVRGSVIRCRNDRDIVIMYAEAAHLLSNAITI